MKNLIFLVLLSLIIEIHGKSQPCNALQNQTNCEFAVGQCQWCIERPICLDAGETCPGSSGGGGKPTGGNSTNGGGKPAGNSTNSGGNSTNGGGKPNDVGNGGGKPGDAGNSTNGGGKPTGGNSTNGGGKPNGVGNGGGKPDDAGNSTNGGGKPDGVGNGGGKPDDAGNSTNGGGKPDGVGNGGGKPQNGQCNALGKNETACFAAECFFCFEKKLCRSSEDKCPPSGNTGGGNFCNKQKNETACSSAGCFFCADKQMCRGSESECPGKGSKNPCKNLSASNCSASDSCLWCAEANMCTGSRGGKCPPGVNASALDSPRTTKCQDFVQESECTSNSTGCRWCPSSSKCKKDQDVCDDGSAGIRGNPCKQFNSTSECSSFEGCLWCMDNNKCKKETDGCEEDSDDPALNSSITGDGCRKLFEAECANMNSTCQWCQSSERCRKLEDGCESRASEAELDVDFEKAGFQLQNEGLGKSDPKKVSVKVNYLFEIAADGTQIESSFVDLESQTFDVTQVQGTFYGIQARKISFDASVSGVGKIEMEVFFMLAAGTLETPAGETYDVEKGDVKFNVNLFNWTFCDPASCGGNAAGEYIDIAVEVLGNSSAPQQDLNDASVFDLGGGVPLLLSNQIEVDGIPDAMPVGYPRTENSDQGTVFVFRFPKFQESASFDPIVQSGAIITITAPETTSPTISPSAQPTVLPATVPPTPQPTQALIVITEKPTSQRQNPIQPIQDESDDGLSSGAITGIAVAIVFLIVGAVIYKVCKSDGERKSRGGEVGNDASERFNDEEGSHISLSQRV